MKFSKKITMLQLTRFIMMAGLICISLLSRACSCGRSGDGDGAESASCSSLSTHLSLVSSENLTVQNLSLRGYGIQDEENETFTLYLEIRDPDNGSNRIELDNEETLTLNNEVLTLGAEEEYLPRKLFTESTFLSFDTTEVVEVYWPYKVTVDVAASYDLEFVDQNNETIHLPISIAELNVVSVEDNVFSFGEENNERHFSWDSSSAGDLKIVTSCFFKDSYKYTNADDDSGTSYFLADLCEEDGHVEEAPVTHADVSVLRTQDNTTDYGIISLVSYVDFELEMQNTLIAESLTVDDHFDSSGSFFGFRVTHEGDEVPLYCTGGLYGFPDIASPYRLNSYEGFPFAQSTQGIDQYGIDNPGNVALQFVKGSVCDLTTGTDGKAEIEEGDYTVIEEIENTIIDDLMGQTFEFQNGDVTISFRDTR